MEKPDLDPELVALGEHALANAFYREFSRLIAKFRAAGAGLNERRLDERLDDQCNLYSTDWKHEPPEMDMGVESPGGFKKCSTMREALESQGTKIVLNGEPVFEWRDGQAGPGWYFVEPPWTFLRQQGEKA